MTMAALLSACSSDSGGECGPDESCAAPDVTSSPASPTSPAAIDLARPEVITTGLEAPWGIAFLPDGDALVSERDSKRVLRVPARGGQATEVLRLEQAQPRGEGGLLGLAVSPSYDKDGWVYAYLTAEDDQGNGLDIATPTAADSVKLLTVHRAKGLEWSSVFCVGVGETRFPSNRSRTLWTSSPAVLPAPLRGDRADQPQLQGHDKSALDAYRTATREHDAEEELRLGYVAFTRAAHHLAVTSYVWAQRASAFGPSDYQQVVREQLEAWGAPVGAWLERPVGKASNPNDEIDPSRPWPVQGPGEEARRRLAAAELVRAADPSVADDGLDLVEAARVADWDDDLGQLLAEARASLATDVSVPLPSSLSATSLARLNDDPDALARELARPMPRAPSHQARFGTDFHAWIEARFGQQALLEPDDLWGRADTGIDEVAELQEVITNFESGPFADRAPFSVEAPFALVLAGQVIRGRIDAVYREDDGSFLVVDWKTNKAETADPLQLAIYRLAWAEIHDVPLSSVRAAFHYVRTGRTVEPAGLPGRAELEQIVAG